MILPWQNFLSEEHYISVSTFRSLLQELKTLIDRENGEAAWYFAFLVERFTPEYWIGVPVKGKKRPYISDAEAMSVLSEFVQPITVDTALKLHGKAFELLQKAAHSGEAEAMHFIGSFYEIGNPPVERNFDEYLRWNEKSFKAGGRRAAGELWSIHAQENLPYYDSKKASFYLDIWNELIRESQAENRKICNALREDNPQEDIED